MRKRSSPWTLLILVLALALAGGGIMEYMRQTEARELADLKAQVDTATLKLSQLRKRESQLKVDEAARKALQDRLADLKDGNLYARTLMAMVNASRATGAALGDISFTVSDSNGIVASGLTTTVSGTEGQVLQFIRRLEEGKPAGWVNTIGWNLVRLRSAKRGGGALGHPVGRALGEGLKAFVTAIGGCSG